MIKKFNTWTLLVAVSVASVGVVAGAQAEQFPSRPIRLLSGFAPGGATDIAARVVAQKLTESLGQPMVVENRPGAAGNIAAEMVARGAPSTVATVSGEAQLMFSSIASMLSQIQQGRLRALAVSSAKRSIVLPHVPTVSEEGLKGYEASSWYGLIVAAATPPAVVSRLSTETVKALALADVKERLSGQGIEPVAGGAEDFRKYVLAEIPKWAKVIRDTKIPPQ